jgi:hypothetical protein
MYTLGCHRVSGDSFALKRGYSGVPLGTDESSINIFSFLLNLFYVHFSIPINVKLCSSPSLSLLHLILCMSPLVCKPPLRLFLPFISYFCCY